MEKSTEIFFFSFRKHSNVYEKCPPKTSWNLEPIKNLFMVVVRNQFHFLVTVVDLKYYFEVEVEAVPN